MVFSQSICYYRGEAEEGFLVGASPADSYNACLTKCQENRSYLCFDNLKKH